jgi:hypothetical protein
VTAILCWAAKNSLRGTVHTSSPLSFPWLIFVLCWVALLSAVAAVAAVAAAAAAVAVAAAAAAAAVALAVCLNSGDHCSCRHKHTISFCKAIVTTRTNVNRSCNQFL